VRDLKQARADALERITALTTQVAEVMAASEGSNADDEHDPEGATIAFERQQLLALLDLARSSLSEIERVAALGERGQDGGQPTGADRLAARPSATRCIACARSQSRGR
jgi:DnaK suppressor protein